MREAKPKWDEVRLNRPLLAWTWRGWALVPLLAAMLLMWIMRVDVLTPSVPLLHRALGWEGLRLFLNVLSFQWYSLTEAEFGIVAGLYLLVFAWLRPRRTPIWVWGVMAVWAVIAQRVHQEVLSTVEVLPGVEVFAARLTLVGTALVLVLFWRNWRAAWPVLFLGGICVAVWHGVNIYGIAVPWNVPRDIEAALFHASIIWMCILALAGERRTARTQLSNSCAFCGYSLDGLAHASGRVNCPECGAGNGTPSAAGILPA